MDPDPKKSKELPSESANSNGSRCPRSPFPDEVVENILSLLDSNDDRNSASLVCKDWYNAERWTRSKLFIRNCYSVSPEIVARRFPRIKSVTLKGRPKFSDFSMLPKDWGANVRDWLVMFAKVYPFLEELRLKRMTINDESLELLAKSFPAFKALSLFTCDGFTDHGLEAIATHCRNLTELDLQDSVSVISGDWLNCFPDNFTSLEILNFPRLYTEVNFEVLERLVSRCRSLRVLKVNENVELVQLQRLLIHTPHLMELGTGTFLQLWPQQFEDVALALSNCKNLRVLTGFWDASNLHFPVLYGAGARLTFLNLSETLLYSDGLAKLLGHCPNLRRLWVLDTVEDKGLEAVGSNCPLLEELRVFPYALDDPSHDDGVNGPGLLAVSHGCPNLRYLLYYCQRMTNAAILTVVQNCPNFTHFRLYIMDPVYPEYLRNELMDEAFCAVAKNCSKLKRLQFSGLVTDMVFEYIGKYAKNLETLSVGYAGSSDRGMQCVLRGCPKLRKLEIRGCPFGNEALLSGLEKYETMRSLWMSGCDLTMTGCRLLASKMPRLNVEVIKEEGSDGTKADKIYVYRTVAGPRGDAPPYVLTL